MIIVIIIRTIIYTIIPSGVLILKIPNYKCMSKIHLKKSGTNGVKNGHWDVYVPTHNQNANMI